MGEVDGICEVPGCCRIIRYYPGAQRRLCAEHTGWIRPGSVVDDAERVLAGDAKLPVVKAGEGLPEVGDALAAVENLLGKGSVG